MSTLSKNRPRFALQDAVAIARDRYGLDVVATPLPGERDQNFRLETASGELYKLKIAAVEEKATILGLQNLALRHLAAADLPVPHVYPTIEGELITSVADGDGRSFLGRLLTYLPGDVLAEFTPHTPALLVAIGRFLGRLDLALSTLAHPAAHRTLQWDLQHAPAVIRQYLPAIADPARQQLVRHFLAQCETAVTPHLPHLRTGIIHGDANDHNLLISESSTRSPTTPPTVHLIDFGDIVHSYVVAELAIAAAYIMLHKPDPLIDAGHLARGYNAVYPLTNRELAMIFPFILLRLCTSVAISAHRRQPATADPYLAISEKPAWALLEKLAGVSPDLARLHFHHACQLPPLLDEIGERFPSPLQEKEALLQQRRARLGPSLSLSYRQPLHIVRGYGQYLYDETGRPYLDGVNNVCHVGHCHPRVVQAASRQSAILNTNTRYLYDDLTAYAERLCASLPAPLSVCYFVNSGSEANDLALRLAQAHTGQRDVIVLEGAYHGNLTSLIAISPYKFDGPGGQGAPDHVHKVSMPDGYRGPYKGCSAATGRQYATHVQQAVAAMQDRGRGVAAFIAESLLGCGGQIVLPDGYLAAAYKHTRAAGGVCIADEVQVGLGRVGTAFWGFQTQGVVPDIVTMGKPLGNGHPLAAVVTTPEIAASFANGMEYFNTFGGNPVSCAVGLTVLNVIAEEGLQRHAHQVGERLKADLAGLMARHSLIGDVRGLGLFIGVELVRDRETLAPAAVEATAVVERMKAHGILLSTDGPLHNVIKIKPPLVFDAANADFLVSTLDQVLREVSSSEVTVT